MEIDEEEDSVEEILGEARLIFVGDEEEYRCIQRNGKESVRWGEVRESEKEKGKDCERNLQCE